MNQMRRETRMDGLVFDYVLDATPEKVWRALTVPQLLAEWLLPEQFSTGDKRSLDGRKAGLSEKIDCEVLDAEQNRRLSWRWRETANGQNLDSVVTFELEDLAPGQTGLRIIHSGLVGATARMPFRAANSNGQAIMMLAA